MPTMYKGQPAYTIAEAIERAKKHHRELAKDIPALIRQKEAEYV